MNQDQLAENVFDAVRALAIEIDETDFEISCVVNDSVKVNVDVSMERIENE